MEKHPAPADTGRTDPPPEEQPLREPSSDDLNVTLAGAPEHFELSADPYPDLARTRARTVRLVISIPVLTMLIVLSAGAVLYVYMMNIAEMSSLPAVARTNLERAALAILLLSVIFSLFSGVVGYVLALQIVRPIRQLMERMEGIATGDFSKGVEPIRLGEFGDLGSTFNRMVDQLNSLFEERDRQIRESFSGAHLVIDESGSILNADHACQRIFGLTSAELVGRNLLEPDAQIPVVERNPRFLDALAVLMEEARSGIAASRSLPIRDVPPKPMMRYYTSCILMEGGSGDAARLLLEVRDITGMPGFYEQIQRADRLAAIGTLATGIAHEIRNPLASIRGMVQLLAEDISDSGSPGGEYTSRILREVDRLEKLVAGIMTFASVDESPTEAVNINAVLREAEESARLHVGPAAVATGIEWQLDEDLPEAVLQAGKLRQAVLNLIVNAYEACAESGRGPVRIETRHLPVNAQRPLIICISNPGEPIDDQTRERLLEPFYTTKPNGTGLGLPIAYQTVLSNGGILEFECEEGEIQFWVRLPRESGMARASSRLIPRLETPLPRHRREGPA